MNEAFINRRDIRDEDVEDPWQQARDVWEANRRYLRPIVAPFIPNPKPPGGYRSSEGVPLAGKRLQVIVKIGSIHLTPENPQYAGGSWHVEGE